MRSNKYLRASAFAMVCLACIWLTPAHAGWRRVTNALPELTHFVPHNCSSFDGYLWLVAGNDVYRSADGENWTAMAAPPGWTRISVTYDNRLWVFPGGSLGAAWTVDGLTWTESLGRPPIFFGTAVTAHSDALFFIGGGHPEFFEPEGVSEGEFCEFIGGSFATGEAFAEVSRYTSENVWSTITEEAEFGMRLLHASVSHDGHIWVLGGLLSKIPWGLYYDQADVWRSTDGAAWEQVTADAGWPARCWFAAVVFEEKIWVLGGSGPGGLKNDVWSSPDGVNWTLEREHAPWGPRYGHTATVHDGKIYVISGQSTQNCPPDAVYRDVWVYDPAEGEGEGEGEGAEGEGEGEGQPFTPHTADQNGDGQISVSELLRIIQFYNSGGFHCADDPSSTEDGYVPGPGVNQTCTPHDSDYAGGPDWAINLDELLRIIQFFNSGGYHPCEGTEDGFCPGTE